MNVLVTGATGFTGQRMMEFLAQQQGVTPTGLGHRICGKVEHKDAPFFSANLEDRDGLEKILANVHADAVIHLAGLTQGPADALFRTNVIGTKNLLDAVVSANPECRILVISSSAVYGFAGYDPIAETALLVPVADYGKSKVEQERVALHYPAGDAAVAVARPFNLAGPGQSDAFVCGRIVNQVVEIEQEKREALELREIISARDLIDVRDVVRGYWSLVSMPDFSGECAGNVFNLGSGNAYPISHIVSLVEEITGTTYAIHVPDEVPPLPVPTQKSDNTRITRLTGWKPEIPLKQTLADMLEAARVHPVA